MVTVDPATYYAAAKAVHSISNDVAAVAGQTLNPGLFDTAGMAGNYAAVRPWLNAYREYSESFVQTVVSFVSATRTMGDILNMVGYHWDLANFNSNRKGTQGHEPQAPVNGSWSPFDKSSISVPDPEPAPYTTPDSGLTTDPRDMQDALRSAIKAGGTEIPKGNTTKLEIGVAGWRAVATNAAITGAAARIQSVAASFDATDTPDKPTLLEMLETLRKGADGIGAAAAGFASGIQPHQQELVNYRAQMAAAAPGAFPDLAVSAGSVADAVTISYSGDATAEMVTTGGQSLCAAVTGHALYAVIANPVFPGMDGMDIRSRLNELAQLQTDSLANLDSWKVAPVKCTLKSNWEEEMAKIDQREKPWLEAAVNYGNAAGVDPRLVMAIVLNEGADKNLGPLGSVEGSVWDVIRLEGSDLRSEWDEGVGNSIGLTNMKETTFNAVKERYPDEFKDVEWKHLAANHDLAVKAAAWNLRYIQDTWAPQFSDEFREKYSINEFMAAGYNAEGMFGDYKDANDFGPKAQSYIEMSNQSYGRAKNLMDKLYVCC